MATRVVSRRVHAAFRVHLGLVAGESLLVAASAAMATIAAALARQSGVAAADTHVQRLAIGILVATLAAVAWALERLEDPSAVARRLDRQGSLDGAVLTAFQTERAGEDSDVARLLAARAANAVSPLAYLRASVRASAPLLALPWFAIALWSLAADRAAPEGGRSSAGSATNAVGAAFRERIEALEGAADRIAEVPDLPPDLRAVCRRISDDAIALAPKAAESPSDGQLRDLERRLDLVRSAIPLEAVTGGDSRGRMTGPHPGTEADLSPTMRAPSPLPPAERSPVEPSEQGVLASRWWATRYDAVVDRWLAARRLLPENAPR